VQRLARRARTHDEGNFVKLSVEDLAALHALLRK
jgi:hypothetical protein